MSSQKITQKHKIKGQKQLNNGQPIKKRGVSSNIKLEAFIANSNQQYINPKYQPIMNPMNKLSPMQGGPGMIMQSNSPGNQGYRGMSGKNPLQFQPQRMQHSSINSSISQVNKMYIQQKGAMIPNNHMRNSAQMNFSNPNMNNRQNMINQKIPNNLPNNPQILSIPTNSQEQALVRTTPPSFIPQNQAVNPTPQTKPPIDSPILDRNPEVIS